MRVLPYEDKIHIPTHANVTIQVKALTSIKMEHPSFKLHIYYVVIGIHSNYIV